jgi:Holliday junction resolvasome RuvABC endonuclease subunit
MTKPLTTGCTDRLVVGLDLGNRTGFAHVTGDGRRLASGSYLCTETKRQGRWARFRGELLGVLPPDDDFTIVIEAFGSRWLNAAAPALLFGLRAHVLHIAEARGVEVLEVAPSTVKRVATGKGNASKAEVFEAVARFWPDYLPDAYDEADALAIALAGLQSLDGTAPPQNSQDTD